MSARPAARRAALILSDAAHGLHQRALAFSDSAGSDGFIDRRLVRRLGATGAVPELVAAGAWLPVQDGYQLADYPRHARLRRIRQAAGRRGAIARWHPEVSSKGDSKPMANAMAIANGKIAVGDQGTAPLPISPSSGSVLSTSTARAREEAIARLRELRATLGAPATAPLERRRHGGGR